MPHGLFLQVVVTVWLSAHHPVTWTLPKLYYTTTDCLARLGQLSHRHKKGTHIELSCEPTDKREI